MSGPLVFTLGDKDYIQKLNQMSQQSGDTQAAKHSAELAAATAQQAVQDARNAGAAEVAKAAAEVAKAAGHVADAKAIAETGLPAQAGKAGAMLVTDGNRTYWRKSDGSDGPVVAMAAVSGINEKMEELAIYAIGAAL